MHTPNRYFSGISFFFFEGGESSIASGTGLFCWLGVGARTYARLRLGSASGGRNGTDGHAARGISGRGEAMGV